MPQRATFVESPSPFGSSLFSTTWFNGRERASTLHSVRSSDAPESPAQSSFSKDGLNDADVKTLDYLGLAETPRQSQVSLAPPDLHRLSAQPFLGELADLNRVSNRFRSYSVNAKEKYAEEEDDYLQGAQFSGRHSGAMTPMEASTAAALAATQAQIHQHNLAVQAFANHASANRPRARTAGILDSPLRAPGNYYMSTASKLDNSMTASDYRMLDGLEYVGLPEAVQALQLNGIAGRSTLDSSEENNQDGPTRSLWLGNIPNSTTVTSLEAIFSPYGQIDSVRVLSQKNCGFVNFDTIESAIQAKSSLNGKEIFPGAGPIKINYGKVPSDLVSGTASHNEAFQSRSPDPHGEGVGENRDAQPAEAPNGQRPVNGEHEEGDAAAIPTVDLADLRGEVTQIVKQFGAGSKEQGSVASLLDSAIAFRKHEASIPPVAESSQERVHDAPKLREIRKRIDTDSIRPHEMEEIAMSMLPEIAELSSDYLGNTVVQKLFEFCSETVKEEMLIRIGPHLAEIGVHKNGTWAAQKIIDVAKVPSQIRLIVQHLRPYAMGLFLDQYGNYVLQCCLRFGSSWNNFIFEAMVSRMWDIAQGRFGARAMRACLESHHATKDQQKLVAAAIVLHSPQLATSANGALLLTWFLDTCTFPSRRVALATRLAPHLVHLCTHKVAYLTLLKLLNQRNELEARDIILQPLFFSENNGMLEAILKDQALGAGVIFKILTVPYGDEKLRLSLIPNVRNVLSRLKVSPAQGYKRLMDEVGLLPRAGRGERDNPNTSRPGSRQDRNRPVSQQAPSNGRRHQTDMERQYSGHYVAPPAQQHFPVHTNIPMSSAMDLNSLPAYDHFTPAFPSQFNQPFRPVLLNPPTAGIPPGNFYPAVTSSGVNGYIAAPAMDQSYASMHAQPSSINQRPMQISVNPLLGQAQFGAPPGFNPLLTPGVMAGAYQYPMQYIPPQQQMMQQQSGGRRARVRIHR